MTLQLEMLKKQGADHFSIVLRRQDSRLKEYVDQYARISGIKVEIVEIQSDRGPGGSLIEAVSPADLKNGVLVLMGDTLIENGTTPLPRGENHVFTSQVQEPEGWRVTYSDKKGFVSDRKHKATPASNESEAAVGYYWFGNVEPETWKNISSDNSERIEFSTILQNIKKAHSLKRTSIAGWLDCGNVDQLLATRRKMTASRSPNTVKIDELRSTVCKRSDQSERFHHSLNYYRLLPHDLAVFFPRLISFETSQPNAHVELEYYAYPSLNEVYLYEEHSSEFWASVMEKIGAIMEKFSNNRVHLDPEACATFYTRKLARRVEGARSQSSELAYLMECGELSINGKASRGIPQLIDSLRDELDRIGRMASGTVIHGDFCFSNILLEPLSKTIRFVNPRGAFHEVGIFGDHRYDHAKLWHSVDGNFDVIMSDMFELRTATASIDFACYQPKARAHILDCLGSIMPSKTSRRDLRLIEGSLFLSMIPLHAGHPRRQIAMLTTGLTILNEEL